MMARVAGARAASLRIVGAVAGVNLPAEQTEVLGPANELGRAAARELEPLGERLDGCSLVTVGCALDREQQLIALLRQPVGGQEPGGTDEPRDHSRWRRPIGFALAMCYGVEYNWPAFLGIWIFRGLLLRYSGRTAYLRFAPFFLGLILGDFLNGGFWTLLGCFTQINVYPINW